MQQEKNTLTKIFNSFLSIFLLSWAGSYTYETLKISDKTDNILQSLIHLPSNFYNSLISESIGTYDRTTTYLLFLIISNAILYFLFKVFIIRIRRKEITKDSYYTNVLMGINSGLMLFLMVISFFNLILQRPVVTNPNINLEIVRSSISEDEYLELRSEYFQVDSSKSLKNFNKKIDEIAKKNNLKTK